MNRCSSQCIRQTCFAVLIGISPIVVCLLVLAVARLILDQLEMFYNRRKKTFNHRSSGNSVTSGRLIVPYTPISHTELQRIIQGEYSTITTNEFSSPTPNFLRSMLNKQDGNFVPSNVLANLVIRHEAIDSNDFEHWSTPLTPIKSVPQPLLIIDNKNNRTRRPSVITITHQSVETKMFEPMLDEKKIASTLVDSSPVEQKTTRKTTTTILVEGNRELRSVQSVPHELNLFNESTDQNQPKTNNFFNFDDESPE